MWIQFLTYAKRSTRETLAIYWLLVRIMVPIMLITELLSRFGVIEAIAPAFEPIMGLVGLPPELGLAWVTCMLIGLWGAVPLIFSLVPVSELTAADITVFSSMMVFAHALPIEQKIIQKAGPGIIVTTLLRIGGGLLFAFILHHIFAATGWLSEPANPAWIPIGVTPDWGQYFMGVGETLLVMLVVLLVLSWGLDVLKVTGILKVMMWFISPVLRLAGIKGEAEHLSAVGLFLGIGYGAGLLIREAQSGLVSPRQVFLSCAFMGFAHAIIEDTLLVIAIGADVTAVLGGRIIFAIVGTAIIAALLRATSDETFFKRLFHRSMVKQAA